MHNSLLFPKLRQTLELRMEESEQGKALLINCPLGISKGPLFLIPEVAPLVVSLEGKLSVTELGEKFAKYGAHAGLINELVSLLDTHYFLESPRYEEFLANYHGETIRPPALAGHAYPSNESSLVKVVDTYLAGALDERLVTKRSPSTLAAFMAPHIDYHRGGKCYGLSYSYLKGAEYDVSILIGTSHQYSPLLFHLTKKHFDTPLGRLECDHEFVTKLAASYGVVRSFSDEILHRREHSLELQCPFMQRTMRSKIVPILVGSFHHMVASGRLPSEFEEYETFAAALSDCVKEWRDAGKKVGIIAGVDMAHIGKHFGDTEDLTPGFMDNIRSRDYQYLAALRAKDKQSLFSHIAEDSDRRRICGFPTMYTVLDVIDRLNLSVEPEVYGYEQAVNRGAGCGVTFAGMGFYEKGAGDVSKTS